MRSNEKQKLLDEYASASRAFADSVERLKDPGVDGEAFIRALAEVGTIHRAAERARINLNKHLASLGASQITRPS